MLKRRGFRIKLLILRRQYLQRKIILLQTINEAKVKAALRTTGEDATQEKLDALICLAVNQEKIELEDKHAKKVGNSFDILYFQLEI